MYHCCGGSSNSSSSSGSRAEIKNPLKGRSLPPEQCHHEPYKVDPHEGEKLLDS